MCWTHDYASEASPSEGLETGLHGKPLLYRRAKSARGEHSHQRICFHFPLDPRANSGLYARHWFGAIAQLVERLHGMQEVSGSIPLSSTNTPTSPNENGAL